MSKMRVLSAALLGFVLIGSLLSPADAATRKVTIKTIATKTAPYKGKVKVKPRVTSSGQVKLGTSRITVRQGGRTIAKRKTSVKLAAGNYSVTQIASYRTYSVKTKQVVVARKGARAASMAIDEGDVAVPQCIVQSVRPAEEDFEDDSIKATCEVVRADSRGHSKSIGTMNLAGTYVDTEDGYTYSFVGQKDMTGMDRPSAGDWFEPVGLTYDRDYTVASRYRAYSKVMTKSRKQHLKVKAGKKPRTCATYSDFKKVVVDEDDPVSYGDPRSVVTKKLHNAGTVIARESDGGDHAEAVEYRTCTRGAVLRIGFYQNHAFIKRYAS